MQVSQSRHSAAASLTLLAICLSAGTARAQSQMPAPTAKDSTPAIIVTATRDNRAVVDIPANARVITQEDIRQTGAQNVADALDKIGAASVRTMNDNPALATVSLRGFGENAQGRILVLRDGQRINNPDMAGINWLQIPVSMVDRIEVLHGSQTALYGDQAVGGVINIITKEAGDKRKGHIAAQGGAWNTWGANAGISGPAQGYRYTADADTLHSGGYRDHSDYDVSALRLMLGRDWSDTLRSGINATIDDSQYNLPGYLSKEQMAADRRASNTPDDDVKTRNLGATFNAGMDLENDNHIDLNAGASHKTTENNTTSWGSFSDTELNGMMAGFRYRHMLTLLGIEHRILAGIDSSLDDMQADRFSERARTTKTVDASISKGNLGGYVADEARFNEQWALELSGRCETAQYKAKEKSAGLDVFDDDKAHTETAGNIGLNYKPTATTKLFTRAGTTYRFPFIDEQASYYGFSDRFFQDLEPETGVNLEAGADAGFAAGWSAGLTVFHLDMQDEIAYNPLTGANENLDTTRRQGVESRLNWAQENNGKAGLFYTWTDASFTGGPNDGSDLPLVPNHQITLSGEKTVAHGLNAMAAAHYTGRQYLGSDYANTQEKLDDYITVDLGMRYTPECMKSLEINAGIDNVLDKEYASTGYVGYMANGYYPAAGRTWKAGAAYRF